MSLLTLVLLQNSIQIKMLCISISQLVVQWLKRVVAGLPHRLARFNPESSQEGFVVDKETLGQDFSLALPFPLPLIHSTHNHHHLSSRAGEIGY
jgi:hypothetical protein